MAVRRSRSAPGMGSQCVQELFDKDGGQESAIEASSLEANAATSSGPSVGLNATTSRGNQSSSCRLFQHPGFFVAVASHRPEMGARASSPHWTLKRNDKQDASGFDAPATDAKSRRRWPATRTSSNEPFGCFQRASGRVHALLCCCRVLRRNENSVDDFDDSMATPGSAIAAGEDAGTALPDADFPVETLADSREPRGSPTSPAVREEVDPTPTPTPRAPRQRGGSGETVRGMLALPSSPISTQNAWRTAEATMAGGRQGERVQPSRKRSLVDAFEHAAEQPLGLLHCVTRGDGDGRFTGAIRMRALVAELEPDTSPDSAAHDAAQERWRRVIAIRKAGPPPRNGIERSRVNPRVHSTASEQAVQRTLAPPRHIR